MTLRLLSKRQARELVGLHEESIMRLSRQGKFPKPIKMVTLRIAPSGSSRRKSRLGSPSVWRRDDYSERRVCSACGVNASCECGVEYIAAGEFAKRKAKQHPDWSNRRVAKEYGLSNQTVMRARAGCPNEQPEKRLGADGKSYPALRVVDVKEPTGGVNKKLLQEMGRVPRRLRGRGAAVITLPTRV